MNSLRIAYLVLFFLLWWNYQGYFIFLFFNARKKRRRVKAKDYNPLVSIIVTTFNERGTIKKKIENLKELAYKNFEVYLVDASEDDTARIIAQNITERANFKLIKIPERGRSRQINAAILQAKGEFILITDCDGLIPKDTLEKMLEEFDDERVGVAGACVVPLITTYRNDTLFWAVQNNMRFMESFYGHSPVVVGVCYAFRKVVLDKLPEDVWADDIYVPFLANLQGFDTVYSQEIIAQETRSPVNFKDFLMHKRRKAVDNIRELMRFFPKIFNMRFRWLVVYLTRFFQILILPLIIYPFFALIFLQKSTILILNAILIIVSGLLQFFIFDRVISKKFRMSPLEAMEVFFITNFILLTAALRYLSFGGRIKYAKIGTITE